jgi:hypothetical protein
VRQNSVVIFAVTGQLLSHRVLQGRPTSATFAVFRDNADDNMTPEFSGSAAIDPVTTTLSAQAGQGTSDPQLVPLASTAGIQTGRKYLLAEASRRQWLEPVEINAGTIRTRHLLQTAFTSAATLQGTTISAAVDATWVADQNNITWFSNTWYASGRYGVMIGDQNDPFPGFRVVWTFVVDGQTYKEYSFFDVVRAVVSHHVDIDDVNARAPGLVDSLPLEYRAEDGRPLIDAAWLSVRAHLTSVKIDVQSLRDDEVLDELVVLRSLRMLAETGWHPGAIDLGSYLKITTDNYNAFFSTHMQVTMKHRTAAGAGGAATLPEPLPFFRK